MSGINVLSRVQKIVVESRTQRIIVDAPYSVSVVNAGPIGPEGSQGSQGVQGVQGLSGSDASVTEVNVEAIIGSRNGIDGYLGLDGSALIPDILIPASIARDTEAQAKADNAQALAQAYSDVAIAALVGSAPEQLNALNELASALGNDPNFATTVNAAIAARATQIALDTEIAARISADDARALLTDIRFTDQRVPTDGSVNANKVATSIKDASASTPSLRTLGYGAAQAASGRSLVAAGISQPPSPTLYFRSSVGSRAAYAFPFNDFRLWLVTLPPGFIRSVAFEVANAGDAASRVRPLFFLPDAANFAPFTLLIDGGQVNTSTAGVKTATVPTTAWAGGPVWVGVHHDAGTAPGLYYVLSSAAPQGVPAVNITVTTVAGVGYNVGTFPQGVPPATFPTGGGPEANPPIVGVECY